jgi:small subunit ribosomal protein S20
MANIKSQIKRNLQNERRRLRNKSVRSALRTHRRRVLEALDAGNTDATGEAYKRAARAYDKAASKGVIHPNNAANHKSRLARALNRDSAG